MSETMLFRNIQKNGDKVEYICDRGKRLDPFVGCLIEWEDADHYIGVDILAKGTYYNECFLPDTFEIYSNVEEKQNQINALKEQLAEANGVIAFYGKKENWTYQSVKRGNRFIKISDVEMIDCSGKWGGKRAREYQKKWSDKK